MNQRRNKNKIQVLDNKRINLMSKLSFINNYNFYLAGGTALALHIKHRISYDFDFYTFQEFDNNNLNRDFKKVFNKKIELITLSKGTLLLKINEIELSFFEYPYKLIKSLVKYKNISLASIEDIAAMKAVAIAQRGRARDFFDIYHLIKIFSLDKLLKFSMKKYREYNEYIILKGLVYFEDAENDIKSKNFKIEKKEWDEIKRFIIKEVNYYVKKS